MFKCVYMFQNKITDIAEYMYCRLLQAIRGPFG